MQSKRIIRIALMVAAILMVPFLAMQFQLRVYDPGDGAEGVNWTLSDFVFAGVLLFGAGLAYDLLARKVGGGAYRAAAALAVGSSLFLVWANLAVGIIGNENNPINLAFFGVIAIGIIGAFAAKLKPRGMARTMLAMAVAQVLIPVITLAVKQPQIAGGDALIGLMELFGVNLFFAMLFAGSALLFHRSGDQLTRA